MIQYIKKRYHLWRLKRLEKKARDAFKLRLQLHLKSKAIDQEELTKRAKETAKLFNSYAKD